MAMSIVRNNTNFKIKKKPVFDYVNKFIFLKIRIEIAIDIVIPIDIKISIAIVIDIAIAFCKFALLKKIYEYQYN
jgi:hypothetical protein